MLSYTPSLCRFVASPPPQSHCGSFSTSHQSRRISVVSNSLVRGWLILFTHDLSYCSSRCNMPIDPQYKSYSFKDWRFSFRWWWDADIVIMFTPSNAISVATKTVVLCCRCVGSSTKPSPFLSPAKRAKLNFSRIIIKRIYCLITVSVIYSSADAVNLGFILSVNMISSIWDAHAMGMR